MLISLLLVYPININTNYITLSYSSLRYLIPVYTNRPYPNPINISAINLSVSCRWHFSCQAPPLSEFTVIAPSSFLSIFSLAYTSYGRMLFIAGTKCQSGLSPSRSFIIFFWSPTRLV